MLTRIEKIDIKKLSDIYDRKNRDSFVSLYLCVERGINYKYIKRREKDCISVLMVDRELLSNFISSMEKIKNYLNRCGKAKRTKSVVIFVSELNNFFAAFQLSLPITNSLIVDTSPYIRPLARLRDEYESYGLILLDNNQAKLYTVSSGVIKDSKKCSAEIMNRHKKGGMSQMRFQRLRKGAIDSFFKEVVEEFQKLYRKEEEITKIIIAGPGAAKVRLKNFLPKQMRVQVLDVVDADIDIEESKLIRATMKKVMADERRRSIETVTKLRTEVLKDECAVHGIRDTLKAVRNGQAELLIVTKNLKIRGWICENCQCVRVGIKNVCPYCNEKTSEVDVIEEIIEFAERTNTPIEFVRSNEILNELGGVGALLRYK